MNPLERNEEETIAVEVPNVKPSNLTFAPADIAAWIARLGVLLYTSFNIILQTISLLSKFVYHENTFHLHSLELYGFYVAASSHLDYVLLSFPILNLMCFHHSPKISDETFRS